MTDVSKISECDFVFAGHQPGFCSNAIYFSSGDWPTVRDYIEGGGRLWLNLEYSGCLGDPSNVASFLSALGSSLSWGNTHEGFSGGNNPGAAAIVDGLDNTDFMPDEVSKIDGGTSVWVNAATGHTVVAVEQLGDGFLFVCGDSDAIFGSTSCRFLRRLWEYADDEII